MFESDLFLKPRKFLFSVSPELVREDVVEGEPSPFSVNTREFLRYLVCRNELLAEHGSRQYFLLLGPSFQVEGVTPSEVCGDDDLY